MAKKKQLAGKSTKLAKLPLTQALARRAEEKELRGRLLRTAVSPLEEDRAPGPLAAVYLYLHQELTALRRQLHPGSEPPSFSPMPSQLPGAPEIKRALVLARRGLHDLQHLLSQA